MAIEILFTDHNCQIDGTSTPRLPVFLKDNMIIWSATDWLLSQRKTHAIRSISTYANQLLEIFRQLEVDGLLISDLDAKYFENYRTMLEARGVGSNYIAQVIGTAFRYMRWMQEEKLVQGLIGPGKDNRIIDPSLPRSRNPLIPKVSRKSSVSTVPSWEQIEVTKSHLPRVNDSLRARDELIVDWAVLRAAEIARIPLSEIPPQDEIDALMMSGQTTMITVPDSKGGGEYPLEVHPELLNRTRHWIEFDRPDVLRAARKRTKQSGRRFIEPPEVFVTVRGKAIDPRTISNTVRNGCKAAQAAGDLDPGVRVWVHGLRHRELTHDYKSRVDAGQRGAEQLTKRRGNHKSIKSTAPYIHLDQGRRNPAPAKGKPREKAPS